MLKRFLMMAAVVLFAAGCSKDDSESDNLENTNPATSTLKASLVGQWNDRIGNTWENASYVFNEDGSYVETEKVWDDQAGELVDANYPGSWTVNEDTRVLTLTPQGEAAQSIQVDLLGGGAWLAFIYEDSGDEWKQRSIQNFHKVGKETVSGKLADGRWDAPFTGFRPEAFTRDGDYRLVLLSSGSNVDLYVTSWGLHIQGSYTLEKGVLIIATDDEHIWQACYGRRAETGDGGWIGWGAWGAPSEEFEDTWDDSYGAIDVETFIPQYPYQWRSIAELERMGSKPNGDYAITYEEIVWEYAQGIREEARDLSRFDFCVNNKGTEAYASLVGLDLWLYKR